MVKKLKPKQLFKKIFHEIACFLYIIELYGFIALF